ncbi:hypothetical protein LXL04_022967 [Taraxacum kok-saghyz]
MQFSATASANGSPYSSVSRVAFLSYLLITDISTRTSFDKLGCVFISVAILFSSGGGERRESGAGYGDDGRGYSRRVREVVVVGIS